MYIQEAQYADDIALFSNHAEDLQDRLSAYNHVSKEMGLQINTSKTETMSISGFSSNQCQASTSRSFQIFG